MTWPRRSRCRKHDHARRSTIRRASGCDLHCRRKIRRVSPNPSTWFLLVRSMIGLPLGGSEPWPRQDTQRAARAPRARGPLATLDRASPPSSRSVSRAFGASQNCLSRRSSVYAKVVADHRADGLRPRVHRTEAALVVVGGLLAAIIYTYPLVRHFTVAIPYALRRRTRTTHPEPGAGRPVAVLLFPVRHRRHGARPCSLVSGSLRVQRAGTVDTARVLLLALLSAVRCPRPARSGDGVQRARVSFVSGHRARRLFCSRSGSAPTASAGAVSATDADVAAVSAGERRGGTPDRYRVLPIAAGATISSRSPGRSAVPVRGAGAGICAVCLALNEPHFFYFFALLLPLWVLFAGWRLEPTRTASWSGPVLGWLALVRARPGGRRGRARSAVRHGRDGCCRRRLAGGGAGGHRHGGSRRRFAHAPAWQRGTPRPDRIRRFCCWPLTPRSSRLEIPHFGLLLAALCAATTLYCKRAVLRRRSRPRGARSRTPGRSSAHAHRRRGRWRTASPVQERVHRPGWSRGG